MLLYYCIIMLLYYFTDVMYLTCSKCQPVLDLWNVNKFMFIFIYHSINRQFNSMIYEERALYCVMYLLLISFANRFMSTTNELKEFVHADVKVMKNSNY
jgi:hypothetical protein